MDKSLEDTLLQAIRMEDLETVSLILNKGANPNKTVGHGKTCLGEAANIGNIAILKLLISASKTCNTNTMKSKYSGSRKRTIKCHKRKLKCDGQTEETNIKCKNLNDRFYKEQKEKSSKIDRNQGYFVFIHSDGSSSDESRITGLKSPLSPTALTPSPQADLEWDEEIGNVAPTTKEDETWTSMYKWYAAILESTGAAIAAASFVTNGLDQQDAFARTALHYAAEQGHVGVVKLLLEAGCKVDVTAGDGFTPLHVAVIKNNVEIVRLLLAAGSNINYKTYEKMTPLHFAASRGFLDLAKILISNGCNIEARDSSERTALYLAAGSGHIEIVKHLISSGANVNGEEIHGYTPLCEAVWQKCALVVDVLLTCGARITHSHRLIHNAIIQRQEEIVQLLANYGGGLNLHNDNGDTPLLLAARLADVNIASVLLQKGANVNSCNSITGANALHIAVECIDSAEVFEEFLKILLLYKIDLNATALTGDTALNRALLLHKDDAAALIIRYGADVNSCDLHSCGLDNLSIASKRKTTYLVNMLIKAGHHRISVAPNADSSECVKWLHYAYKNPLTLSDLCRIKIRHMCKNVTLYKYVSNLPLPNSLKRFLMMQDDG